jgi:hypothetical protein
MSSASPVASQEGRPCDQLGRTHEQTQTEKRHLGDWDEKRLRRDPDVPRPSSFEGVELTTG